MVQVRDTLKSETNKTAKRNIEKAASSGSKKGLETFLYKENLYQDNLEAFDLCETKYKKIIGRKIDIKKYISDVKQYKESKKANKKELTELYNNIIDIFGIDNFYFEIQNHGLDSEKILYNELINFAIEMKNTNHFIASNDIHIGICKDFYNDNQIENEVKKRNIVQFTRFNKYSPIRKDDYEYTIKNNKELSKWLNKIFDKDIVNQAIDNIEVVLNKCQEIKFPKVTIDGYNFYPIVDNANEVFKQKIQEGIKKRFPNGFPDKEKYEKEIEYETNIIISMGYAAYHLIVADYLEYGRLLGYVPTNRIDDAPLSIEELDKWIDDNHFERIGQSIGPGRGSACGSEDCYVLGITDIDPIPYNLYFERFLNPERVSMPKQHWVSTVNLITQGCNVF